MLSLADLRARNVTLTWQEAVAVVQELAATVAANGSVERFPDLQHIALIPNGDVVPLPGAPVVADPVRHVATLLGTLVERTSAPPELTAFVRRTAAVPPPFATVDELTRALAFFERPGRRADLEKLVARVITSEAQAVADDELRKIALRSAAARQRSAGDATVRRRWRTPAIAALAVAIACAAAAAVYLRSGRASTAQVAVAVPQKGPARPTPSPATRPPAPTAPVSAAAEALPSSAASRAIVPVPAAPTPPPAPPRAEPASLPPPSRAPSSVAAVAPRRVPTSPPQRAAAAARRESPPPAQLVPAEPRVTPIGEPVTVAPLVTADERPTTAGDGPAAVATRESSATIYTADDPGVTPPMMLRPMLPAEPPLTVPADQVGTLDLVIDEAGNVEQVRLSSPANRYQERMLVASAKSWKFRPATRNGRPVKYRARLRVTI